MADSRDENAGDDRPPHVEWFDSACYSIDVFFVPLVGLAFAAGGVLIVILGRVGFNGREVTFADDPVRFSVAVASCLVIGLGCMGFGAVRWLLQRRRIRAAANERVPPVDGRK